MKLTIRTNAPEKNVKIINNSNSTFYAIEIDYQNNDIFSDFELWLEDDNGQQKDYRKLTRTRKNTLILK